MVLPLIGGILLDVIGIRISLVIFNTLFLIGTMVFAVGVSGESLTVMLVGRLIMGLGGQCVMVAQAAIVSVWFKGKESTFAFGITLAISGFSAVLCGVMLSPITESDGLPTACWVAFICCAASYADSLALCVLDKFADSKD